MGALDHFLNGLNAVLKHGDRVAAEKAEARKAAKPTGTKLVRGSFDALHTAPAPVADPSCCLAKRRVK